MHKHQRAGQPTREPESRSSMNRGHQKEVVDFPCIRNMPRQVVIEVAPPDKIQGFWDLTRG